jgi:hypothetical protein
MNIARDIERHCQIGGIRSDSDRPGIAEGELISFHRNIGIALERATKGDRSGIIRQTAGETEGRLVIGTGRGCGKWTSIASTNNKAGA